VVLVLATAFQGRPSITWAGAEISRAALTQELQIGDGVGGYVHTGQATNEIAGSSHSGGAAAKRPVVTLPTPYIFHLLPRLHRRPRRRRQLRLICQPEFRHPSRLPCRRRLQLPGRLRFQQHSLRIILRLTQRLCLQQSLLRQPPLQARRARLQPRRARPPVLVRQRRLRRVQR